MNITNGIYRGIKISFDVDNNGEFECSLEICHPYLKNHFEVFENDELRKIFNLPSNNGFRFSFYNLFKPDEGLEKDNYIYWKFHSLECVSTYTFLANIFRRIDKMFEVFFEKSPYPKFKYELKYDNPNISDKDIENINAKLNDASSK